MANEPPPDPGYSIYEADGVPPEAAPKPESPRPPSDRQVPMPMPMPTPMPPNDTDQGQPSENSKQLDKWPARRD